MPIAPCPWYNTGAARLQSTKSSTYQILSSANQLINSLSSPLNTRHGNINIQIDVELDDQKVPQTIEWTATDGTMERPLQAKAFILSLWDGADKTALRIDLWTQKMMVDEMADFYFQTMMTMAETFERATRMTELTGQMKAAAQQFYRTFQEMQLKENKA